MLDLNFDPFPVLKTQRLILRELSLNDSKEIFIQRSHPEIAKYIHRPIAKDINEAIQFIQKVTLNQKNEESITWAISKIADPLLIGTICLWNIDKMHDTAELGYSLHPDHFKQGLMNEAVVAVCDYGFRQIKVRRIDAFTNKNNQPSLSLLARNGFTRNQHLEVALEDKTELEYNQIFSLANTSK
jgi:ribosomal-protein-alanine N-acetyltransferase